MLSNKRYREYRSSFQTPKIIDMLKHSTSGTLSSETTTTTTSGYSTGGSSVSNAKNPYFKESSSFIHKQYLHQSQHKTKSKGLHNILSKLKNFLLPSKSQRTHSRTMKSTISRQTSSTDMLRQYYDVLPSSKTTNNVSLSWTYYPNLPIRYSRTNFEKISAWLDHAERLKRNQSDGNKLLHIDRNKQNSISSSTTTNHNQVMKTNIKPPKRSSSLVTRITRPIIEQQLQRTISPATSFNSSILTREISDRITPSSRTDYHLSKFNRRRTIDFSRRRTVTNVNEYNSKKENYLIKKDQEKSSFNIYQFSPLTSTNKTDIHIPSSYYHSNSIETKEDLLNNSYGLTLLQQPIKSIYPIATILNTSQISNHRTSQKPRTFIQQEYTLDSLDDLLCDREVESYFYPNIQKENIYMNLENSSNSYQPLLSYIHETLC